MFGDNAAEATKIIEAIRPDAEKALKFKFLEKKLHSQPSDIYRWAMTLPEMAFHQEAISFALEEGMKDLDQLLEKPSGAQISHLPSFIAEWPGTKIAVQAQQHYDTHAQPALDKALAEKNPYSKARAIEKFRKNWPKSGLVKSAAEELTSTLDAMLEEARNASTVKAQKTGYQKVIRYWADTPQGKMAQKEFDNL